MYVDEEGWSHEEGAAKDRRVPKCSSQSGSRKRFLLLVDIPKKNTKPPGIGDVQNAPVFYDDGSMERDLDDEYYVENSKIN